MFYQVWNKLRYFSFALHPTKSLWYFFPATKPFAFVKAKTYCIVIILWNRFEWIAS